MLQHPSQSHELSKPASPSNRTLLDFAIVGQPKSGTTALARFLSEHPSISMSVPKESAFFATDFHRESDAFHGRPLYYSYRTPQDFERLFEHARPGDLLGEGSTSSLYSTEAAVNLHGHNPDMKIIMMFRDPAVMVQSLHMQYVNETVEDIVDFGAALEAEQDRKAGRRIPRRVRAPSYLFYSERGKYREQMERFAACFPPEQILVLFTEEFREDNEAHYVLTLRFLGVDDGFRPTFEAVHGSKAPRSPLLNRLLNNPAAKRTMQRLLGPRRYTRLRDRVADLVMEQRERQPALAETVDELRTLFRPEVERFGMYVERDLLGLWSYRE